MVIDARRTVIDALDGKGWTLSKLHEESRISCSRVSLHRKLYGYRKPGTKRARIYQPLTVDDFRRLARALGVLTDEAAAQLDQIAGLGLRGAA